MLLKPEVSSGLIPNGSKTEASELKHQLQSTNNAAVSDKTSAFLRTSDEITLKSPQFKRNSHEKFRTLSRNIYNKIIIFDFKWNPSEI